MRAPAWPQGMGPGIPKPSSCRGRRREVAGLTQKTLADEAGVHRTYFSLLERR
jgi:predicted transcriptional regulator